MAVELRQEAAGPGDVVRSVVFYLIFYFGTIFYVLGSLAALPFNQRLFQRVVEGWSWYHRQCVTGILLIKVEERGDLPQEPVLFAIKHESFFEAIDLPHLLPHPVVFAKAELLRLPLWGMAGLAYGLIPVQREAGAKALRAMFKSARELTSQGRPASIFPEGTRVPHGATTPLLYGFAGLYKMLGMPVVPVAVDSGPLYHRRWKKRGTLTIAFGEPIPPGLPRDEIEQRVHAAINALNS